MKLSLILSCTLLYSVSYSYAAKFSISDPKPFVLEDVPNVETFDFWELASYLFENRIDRSFYNSFRPARAAQISLQFHGDHERAYTRARDKAVGNLHSSVRYAAREMLMLSPIYIRTEEWLIANARYVGEFLHNSVDSIDEEEIRALDMVSSESEQSWFRKVRREHSIKYGIRPRHNPYFFVSSRVSHQNETLFVVSVRYHLEDFSEHRMETVVSIPIAHHITLSSGFTYEINNPEDIRMVVRVSKYWKRTGATASLGVVVLVEQPRLVAEVAVPWGGRW